MKAPPYSCSPGTSPWNPGQSAQSWGSLQSSLAYSLCGEGLGPQALQQSPLYSSLPIASVHQASSTSGCCTNCPSAWSASPPDPHPLVNSSPSTLCSDLTFLMKPALYKTGLISIAVKHTTPDIVGAKHHQNIDGFCGSETWTGLTGYGLSLLFPLCWHLGLKWPETRII
uniref:Uncharacterized protein n=1 Tax=Molossus molossus TaxID=27622 RepID=A0A7J8B8E5_MOLMO|nr:hypothetical protein HJG59_010478 [Molossus molossus]